MTRRDGDRAKPEGNGGATGRWVGKRRRDDGWRNGGLQFEGKTMTPAVRGGGRGQDGLRVAGLSGDPGGDRGILIFLGPVLCFYL